MEDMIQLNKLRLERLHNNPKNIRFLRKIEKLEYINKYCESLYFLLEISNRNCEFYNSCYHVIDEDKVGFVYLDKCYQTKNVDLTYLVYPKYIGNGYGTKIIQEVSDYIFETDYGINRVGLAIDKNNNQSINSATDAGFQFLRQINKYYKNDIDHHLYVKFRK